MADTLHFSLVSPERELFSGAVDQVVVPGSEGEFGVLPNHAPFMATVKPGALRILMNGGERRMFVNGGFADVTPAGLTVLAEDAVDLAAVEPATLDAERQRLQEELSGVSDPARIAALEAKLVRLEAIKAALAA